MADQVDGKYYQVIQASSLAERILVRARAKIYADFIDHMAPRATDTVLDVGVSDIINDGANVLEREYPYQDRITACGLSDAEAFRAAFPRCHYRKITANAPLPFDDNSFEIATSNAVLEHVGSLQNQIFFVRELCRVASKVFISVPHRYFPIEHHTLLPFVHYSDALFNMTCRMMGKTEWSDDRNLIFVTRKSLETIKDHVERKGLIGYTGIRLGALSSNLFLSFS